MDVGLRPRRLRFARRRRARGARPVCADGERRRRAPVRFGEARRRQRGAARLRPRPRAGRRRDRAGRGVGGRHAARRPMECFTVCCVRRGGRGARRPRLPTSARADRGGGQPRSCARGRGGERAGRRRAGASAARPHRRIVVRSAATRRPCGAGSGAALSPPAPPGFGRRSNSPRRRSSFRPPRFG